MSTLYLLEQGAKLEKESKRLIVGKEDKILLEAPEFKIGRALLFGNIQITTQAMSSEDDNLICCHGNSYVLCSEKLRPDE